MQRPPAVKQLKQLKQMSDGEGWMALHLRASKLPMPVREHQFMKDRKYRFDFCWPDLMLAVEIDGGNAMAVIGKDGKAYAIGRHTKAADYAKLNHAATLGWRVLRFTPKMVKSGLAIETIEKAIRGVIE